MDDAPDDGAAVLLAAADRIESLAARTTAGSWQLTGLLGSRPQVVARFGDGSTEHVAEVRAHTGEWIATLSPAVGGPLAAWLRAAGNRPGPAGALAVARLLLG
ncbi:hypothetical protein SAMN05661080_01434 [Modestobacter sp. DSM 44400]|uniref:hypothetical protein n=1 Tax=Modestobacter sp. DSM 44400 TaxID=1550230 RepID=UPI00089B55ED|nr:hypothetical protein [Modestobacter sp. DSM 44400]SDX84528.1 hypothetical protein SAMN05661080_01434 [Modestobacter sp. DSM 44400]